MHEDPFLLLKDTTMTRVQRPLLSAVVALAAVLAASGCGNQAGSRFVTSKDVDAAGGTISVAATALAGTSLDVPPGALAATTRLTLELGLDDLVASADVAGPVAIWGPAGTRFSKKARMTLPLSISAAAGELTVQVREADGREFELPASAVQVADGRISFDVDGFTSFQPRRRSATVCPADARLCPDGSSVSRTGPNCTFPACPGETDGGAVVCPADVRLCPDGSSVSRTGPRCEFVCPGGNTCNTNADCMTGQVCSAGLCVAPDGGGAGGESDGGAVVCPADVRLCSDGSSVSRTGPRCEFVCPGGNTCNTNADCMTGQVCSAGLCVAPDGGGAGGASDGGAACTPPVCTLACQYGFARDAATGCEQCRCNPGPALDGGAAPCFRGGCSNQLCSDQPGLESTCEWRPQYACYQQAACERQSNGTCGHTPSPALTACLAGAADGGRP
jgi:hypothetical protein